MPVFSIAAAAPRLRPASLAPVSAMTVPSVGDLRTRTRDSASPSDREGVGFLDAHVREPLGRMSACVPSLRGSRRALPCRSPHRRLGEDELLLACTWRPARLPPADVLDEDLLRRALGVTIARACAARLGAEV
jgi:hypothetical protein